jgi:hypothetical protein
LWHCLGKVERGALAGNARGAGSNSHGNAPGTGSTHGEGRAIDALERTLSAAAAADRRRVVVGRGSRGRGRGRAATVDRVVDDGRRGSAGARTNRAAVAHGVHVSAGTKLNDVLARVGELEVATFGDAAGGLRDMRNEHVGEAVGADASGATSNLNGGTVHVHLTVAQSVEPSPGKSVRAHWQVWDLNLVALGKRQLGVTGLNVASLVLGWAATLNGLDDLPAGALSRVRVRADRDLARATTVDGGAHELDGLGAAGLPGGGINTGEAGGSAREGGRDGRGVLVVEGSVENLARLAVGGRVAHDNVSRGHGGDAGDGERLGKHVGEWFGLFVGWLVLTGVRVVN